MNDFTKEELVNLLSALCELLNEITQPPCIHELMDKIKSMIDSYCEHECTYDSSACAQICRDCEKIL